MSKAARYIGKPETTQIGGGNWLAPGDVITDPPALVTALLVDKNAFEEVDMSLPEPEDTEQHAKAASKCVADVMGDDVGVLTEDGVFLNGEKVASIKKAEPPDNNEEEDEE